MFDLKARFFIPTAPTGLMYEARTAFIEAALTTLDFSPRYFSALEFRPKQRGRVRANSLPGDAPHLDRYFF
ncbi:hypothetical protein ABIF79_008248 [Bradyrhizobium japonicum]